MASDTLADPHARRNFKLNVFEGAISNTGLQFYGTASILPLFVAHYTRAPWALGLITAVSVLGTNVMQVFGAALSARLKDFWRTVLGFTLASRSALLLMCLTPWLPHGWVLWGFFLSFALYQSLLGANTPPWLEMCSHIVAPEERGAFFGLRNSWSGVTSMVGSGLASWLLTFPAPYGFGACFLASAACWWISLATIALTRYDWSKVERARAAAPDFRETAREVWRSPGPFGRYMLSRFVTSASMMANGFYVVFAQQHFALTPSQGALLGIAFVVAPTLGGALWGRAADRWGNKPVQAPVLGLAAMAHLGVLFASDVWVYAAALFVVGSANVVNAILDYKWVMEWYGARSATLMSFFNLALAPSAVILSLCAGLLAMAWGTPVVFALAGLAWLLGAGVLAGMVREPQPSGAIGPEAA